MLDAAADLPVEAGLETPFLLAVLVALEAVLSADNAIALAAIAQGLPDKQRQRQALNFGLVAAYVLRVALILMASWVVQFWQFQVLGSLYLLWLAIKHFAWRGASANGTNPRQFASFWQVIPAIALADLAFSLDSVTTAVAIADETWLVVAGGTIGVIALRFLAGWFIQLLNAFERLEDAGYLTVGLVGLRLLVRAIAPAWVPPEWVMVAVVGCAFAWGFSKRTSPALKGPDERASLIARE